MLRAAGADEGRPRSARCAPSGTRRTRPRRAGSATPTTRSAGCAARGSPVAGRTSRSRSGATSPTTSAACAIVREEIGSDGVLMVDANQVWDVDQAIDMDARAGAGSTPAGSRSRRARTTSSATHASRGRSSPRIGVATGEHVPEPGDLQAVAPGRCHRLLPGRLLPPRRRQRSPRRPADGRQVRGPGLSARRRRRPVRVRPAPLDLRLHRRQRVARRSGSSNTSTTCTSTSSIPS